MIELMGSEAKMAAKGLNRFPSSAIEVINKAEIITLITNAIIKPL